MYVITITKSPRSDPVQTRVQGLGLGNRVRLSTLPFKAARDVRILEVSHTPSKDPLSPYIYPRSPEGCYIIQAADCWGSLASFYLGGGFEGKGLRARNPQAL